MFKCRIHISNNQTFTYNKHNIYNNYYQICIAQQGMLFTYYIILHINIVCIIVTIVHHVTIDAVYLTFVPQSFMFWKWAMYIHIIYIIKYVMYILSGVFTKHSYCILHI